MTDEEAHTFEQDPLFADILAMREFDEKALEPAREDLDLDAYAGMMKNTILRDLFLGQKSIVSNRSLSSIRTGKSVRFVEAEDRKEESVSLRRRSNNKDKEYYSNQKKAYFFNPKTTKNMPNRCALDHDRKFRSKIENGKAAMKKLLWVACICFLFMIVELVGGYFAGSLAVMTDAAHMFSDVAGFMISFFSILISQN